MIHGLYFFYIHHSNAFQTTCGEGPFPPKSIMYIKNELLEKQNQNKDIKYKPNSFMIISNSHKITVKLLLRFQNVYSQFLVTDQ